MSHHRYRFLEDDPDFGITKGDVFVGMDTTYDPDKVLLCFRESDRWRPECSAYRYQVKDLGPVPDVNFRHA